MNLRVPASTEKCREIITCRAMYGEKDRRVRTRSGKKILALNKGDQVA